MDYKMHLKAIEDVKQVPNSDKVKATVLIAADEMPDDMPMSGEEETVEGLSKYVIFASLSILIIVPSKKIYVWNETT